MIEFRESQYGFQWGPVAVQRLFSHKGAWLEIDGGRQKVVVHVTPSGLIRVWTPKGNCANGGGQWTPPKKKKR